MKIIWLITLLSLTGCSIGAPHSSQHYDEIAYQKKNTIRVDIFNMTSLHFSNEDTDYLKNRNFKYGEFGGVIKNCSNDEYYCLIGGIGVVIPKKFTGQREWAFLDEKCKSEAPLTDKQTAIITCDSSGWSNRFVYSSDRGITSYVIAAQPQAEYELVDAKGLFANPEMNSFNHEAVHKVD